MCARNYWILVHAHPKYLDIHHGGCVIHRSVRNPGGFQGSSKWSDFNATKHELCKATKPTKHWMENMLSHAGYFHSCSFTNNISIYWNIVWNESFEYVNFLHRNSALGFLLLKLLNIGAFKVFKMWWDFTNIPNDAFENLLLS